MRYSVAGICYVNLQVNGSSFAENAELLLQWADPSGASAEKR